MVDSDHWRHYFLLISVIWGLMAVSRSYAGRGARAETRKLARASAPDSTAMQFFRSAR
jgi:hypothetical protein